DRGRIAGVTSSSEYFVATAGEVARSLGLPHPDPQAVRSCRDKHAQRSQLRNAGLPCPDFAAARTPEAAAAAAAGLGFPAVVKPRLAGGMIPRIVEESCGIDMIGLVVANAAGRVATLRPTRCRSASIRFLVATTGGCLAEIGGIELAGRLPGVAEIGVLCQAG